MTPTGARGALRPWRGQLLVLAKAPLPGRVKTRLCPPCTPQQAARLAAAALADTLDAVRAVPGCRRVLALDGGPVCRPTGFEVVRQHGGGLGERIAAAFADTAAGGVGPILQVGMDTPQISPRLLAGCLAALAAPRVDAVLGPAEDGGWWALGLHDHRYAGLLAAVPMSTPDTYRLTLAALRSAGLRVAALPRRQDVDLWPDALAVADQAPHTRFAAEVRRLGPAADRPAQQAVRTGGRSG
jgi:rSAM/selenodomain-associated transferase 1